MCVCVCVCGCGCVKKRGERERDQIRVAEWLGTVTLVWEVWVQSPEMMALTRLLPRVLKYFGRSLHDNSLVFLVP